MNITQVGSSVNPAPQQNQVSPETSAKRCGQPALMSHASGFRIREPGRGKRTEVTSDDSVKTGVMYRAASLQTPVSIIKRSRPSPQPVAPDICDHGLQVATEGFYKNLAFPQPSAETSGKTCVGERTLLNHVSAFENRGKQGSIKPASVSSTATGSSHPGLLSFSDQGSDAFLLRTSQVELEYLFSELKGDALIPSLRPNEPEKSDVELTEEWANVCSQVLCITSYLAMAKAAVKHENLASRLDNLKALKNSFDCSALIRCFDRLLSYLEVIETDKIVKSNLQRGYFSRCRLHEAKKSKNVVKAKLLEKAASELTNNIACLELELQYTYQRIMDLRKLLVDEEMKMENVHTSIKTARQEEAALVDEKSLIASENAILDVEGKELEDYQNKISAEAEDHMERIKALVKQLTISLSMFNLMDAPCPWKKE